MQAPQLRLNERQANPNPFIIFIRSLRNKKNHTEAEDILKAVAAQMKTIMRDRFMQVHTLEEAAFNRVFAGRNWNHGQSIELVLRGPSGRFLPMPYIISVVCHEMAHIEQMNHGAKFQKLMAEIKADVSRLQAKGYYGDGFWSDGKRLADSVKMGGEGLRPSDFPEYVCGVSAADARKARRPNRGPGSSQIPGLVKGEASHRSGRQTEYTRKAGRRNNADMGEEGARLDGGKQISKEDREARKVFVDDRTQLLLREGLSLTTARRKAGEMFVKENPWWNEGSTRGKVAKSKSAAEMRAAAAERRLAAFTGSSLSTKVEPDAGTSKLDRLSKSPSPSDCNGEEDEDEDEDEDIKPNVEDEVEDPHLNAEERRREMEDEMDEDEMSGLRGGWEDYISGDLPSESDTIRDGSEKKLDRKRRASPIDKGMSVGGQSIKNKVAKLEDRPTFGSDMIRQERLKALGLGDDKASSRTLGIGTDFKSLIPVIPIKEEKSSIPSTSTSRIGEGWECRICTYVNIEDHGRCDMCQARPDGSVPADVR